MRDEQRRADNTERSTIWMETDWESQLAALLARLSSAQEQLLALLTRKGELLRAHDRQGLTELAVDEQALVTELQECHDNRLQLLADAEAAGMPADSIRSLLGALPPESAQTLRTPLDESIKRSQVLRHQSVAQWVLVQRTLLHLSHMLEIIATGGHGQPTYGEGGVRSGSGTLMDQAV